MIESMPGKHQRHGRCASAPFVITIDSFDLKVAPVVRPVHVLRSVANLEWMLAQLRKERLEYIRSSQPMLAQPTRVDHDAVLDGDETLKGMNGF